MRNLPQCLFITVLLATGCAGIAGAPPASAGEVLSSHVEYENGHFLVDLNMRINAKPARVRGWLTDYNHLHRVNGAILTSRLISNDGTRQRVFIETRGCVLFFCKRIVQYQDISEPAPGYLVSRIDPSVSDFSYGRVVWHLWHDQHGTRVRFSADLVPKFWVPPLIGPWAIKRKLLEEAQQTITGLETLANTTP